MTDQPITLTFIRPAHGDEPIVVVPYHSTAWLGIKRLQHCAIAALPESDLVFAPEFWCELHGRDVTFWPIDAWSGHVFTLIYINLRACPSRPFKALRWAWPKPGNLGELQRVDTLWNGEKPWR